MGAIMDHNFWLAVIINLLGIIGAVGLAGWNLRGFIAGMIEGTKADFLARLTVLENDQDNKREKLEATVKDNKEVTFRRFDEHKKAVNVELLPQYVRRDLWEMKNSSLESTLRDLATEIRNYNIKIDSRMDEFQKALVAHMVEGKK
jgi:hypothetical protein